jgi:hypothetical protein
LKWQADDGFDFEPLLAILLAHLHTSHHGLAP